MSRRVTSRLAYAGEGEVAGDGNAWEGEAPAEPLSYWSAERL
jgi:hypothetical protein